MPPNTLPCVFADNLLCPCSDLEWIQAAELLAARRSYMQNPQAGGKAVAAGRRPPPAADVEKKKTPKKKAAVTAKISTGMKPTSPGVDIGLSSSLIAVLKKLSVTEGGRGQASASCNSEFTADSILDDLRREQIEHPEQEVVTKGNIRHLQYNDISAYVSLYFEDGKNYMQFRVGYIYDTQVVGGTSSLCPSPAGMKKKNFKGFLGLDKNNPYVLQSGLKVTFRDMFLSEPEDEKHRFGADFILDDIGLESCAELLDYILTCKF